MLNDYVVKTKVYFSILVIGLILLVLGGSGYIANTTLVQNFSSLTSGVTQKLKVNSVNTKGFLFKSSFREQSTNIKSAGLLVEGNDVKAKSVPVVYYHGINDSGEEGSVSLGDFKEQMVGLKNSGYETITLADFQAFMEGKKELPQKAFLLTFDDGRKDSFYPVDPILQMLDYNAVMFVITSTFEQEGDFYLTHFELNEMLKSGRWEIQSHSENAHSFINIDSEGNQGHFLTNKLWLENEGRLETDKEYASRIKFDLLESKGKLESHLNSQVTAFAFPFGDFGQDSINYKNSEPVLQKLVGEVYDLAFYQPWNNSFQVNYAKQNGYVKRLGVDSGLKGDSLVEFLTNNLDKTLDFYDDFNINVGWYALWGDVTISAGKMMLKPQNYSGSAGVYLAGSGLWQDYTYTLKARVPEFGSFTLRSRVDDQDNFLGCSFSADAISLFEVFNGLRSTKYMAQVKIQNEVNASMVVQGNTVSCLVDGRKVATGNVARHTQRSGVVGINYSADSMLDSSLVVEKVSVENFN